MRGGCSRSARSSGRSVVARMRAAQLILVTAVLVLLPAMLSAQSPWERAAGNPNVLDRVRDLVLKTYEQRAAEGEHAAVSQ